MRNLFLFCLIILIGHRVNAQDIEKLLTGRDYWYEEQNERYQTILQKKETDLVLSAAEEQWFSEFHDSLKDYFSKLSDVEKEEYFVNKDEWNAEKAGVIIDKDETRTLSDESESLDVLETNAKGIQPGKKYLMYNGIYGFLYGMGLIAIVQPEDEATALALPLISTSLGLLWPVLNSKRYENITYNSVLLARHGKFMGSFHGVAIGLTIFGIENSYSTQGIVGLGILGSLAGAETGYQLGQKKDWTEGRVATYKHYGVLIPVLNFFTLAATRVDNPRVYGATTLLSGAAGYWVADKVVNHFENTRGDMLALSSFTALSAIFTIGFVDFESTTDLFVPLVGTLAGTIAGQSILKNKKLSVKEGWRVNYITGAGLIFGLGVAVIAGGESHAPYLILPAVGGGLGWYAMMHSALKNRNLTSAYNSENWGFLSVDFTPENYYFNKSTWKMQSETFNAGLPVMGLKFNF